MSGDYLLFLEDMQDACRKLLKYTEGMALDQFVNDERTYDAAVCNLVILGKAAKQRPFYFRDW